LVLTKVKGPIYYNTIFSTPFSSRVFVFYGNRSMYPEVKYMFNPFPLPIREGSREDREIAMPG
jgi:hypothetical protein